MKRLVMVMTLSLVTVLTFAQSEEEDDKKKKKTEILAMLIGSVHFSNISGESDSYNGLLLGGQVGGQINLLNLSDRISLRVGIEFSSQGGKYEEKGGEYGGNYTGKLRTSYLNFPVTAAYQSKSGFYAEAGLQPGVLLAAKDKVEGQSNDYKEYMNKFDMGIVVGGGYLFTKHIGAGVRVVPGITNINKKQSTYSAPKDHNMVIGVRGFYIF